MGWADAAGCENGRDGVARPTHSTALDERGVPTMAAGEAMAAQQRHRQAHRQHCVPVYGLLFDDAPKLVSHEAQSELAYLLAGVGCRPPGRWAWWRQRGRRARASRGRWRCICSRQRRGA